jgi:hypothetical protein
VKTGHRWQPAKWCGVERFFVPFLRRSYLMPRNRLRLNLCSPNGQNRGKKALQKVSLGRAGTCSPMTRTRPIPNPPRQGTEAAEMEICQGRVVESLPRRFPFSAEISILLSGLRVGLTIVSAFGSPRRRSRVWTVVASGVPRPHKSCRSLSKSIVNRNQTSREHNRVAREDFRSPACGSAPGCSHATWRSRSCFRPLLGACCCWFRMNPKVTPIPFPGDSGRVPTGAIQFRDGLPL